ncbi:MAG: MFS transporter [Burkholderiales bacterium]
MNSPAPRAFAALRNPQYRNFFICSTFATTADSMEHVVSYWILYQLFSSPTLGGVAVLTHWLPFLFFSVYAGSLADRFDPRRLIQISQALMMLVSLGWAIAILTGSLTEWVAVLLLMMHGTFGVMTVPASQLVVHEMVGRSDLQSAVRTNASSRHLGWLLGPAIGGALMLATSPAIALFVNMAFYLPVVTWAIVTRRRKRREAAAARSDDADIAVAPAPAPARTGGFAEVADTLRRVASDRVIFAMVILAGGAALFVGNAYQPQMPEFAHDLGGGHDHNAGIFYTMLLSADAIGAITAVIVLESRGLLKPHPRTAIILTVLWCLALTGFAVTTVYPLAIALMFAAGFLNLSFNAMAQTLVQMRAPAEVRGRIVGLFATASLGLRAFSGVTVGVVGGLIGIHWSLAASAMALLATAVVLLALSMRR